MPRLGSKRHSQLRLFPFAVFEIICMAPSWRPVTAAHVVPTAAHLALDALEEQLPTRVTKGRREKRLTHLCKPKNKSQPMKETSAQIYATYIEVCARYSMHSTVTTHRPDKHASASRLSWWWLHVSFIVIRQVHSFIIVRQVPPLPFIPVFETLA